MTSKAKKTRRPYRSLAEATEAAQSATRERDVLHLALYDNVLGRVQWLEESHEPTERDPEAVKLRVGVSRLTSPHGGIVVVHSLTDGASAHVSAHYLDDWARRATETRRHTDNAAVRLEDVLARRALALRQEAWDAETERHTGSDAERAKRAEPQCRCGSYGGCCTFHPTKGVTS